MDDIRFLEKRFFREIVYHLGKAKQNIPLVFTLSTDKQDSELSFDIVSKEVFVSVRIRSNYYIKYSDITIRSRSQYGGRTEIDKIIERDKINRGIYFYAWLNKTGVELDKILIIDINSIIKATTKKQFRFQVNKEPDNTGFNIYDPKNLNVLYQWEKEHQLTIFNI